MILTSNRIPKFKKGKKKKQKKTHTIYNRIHVNTQLHKQGFESYLVRKDVEKTCKQRLTTVHDRIINTCNHTAH